MKDHITDVDMLTDKFKKWDVEGKLQNGGWGGVDKRQRVNAPHGHV